MNDSDETNDLLKQFNKIISSTTLTSNPFTNTLFKMYYNLLKIQTNINSDESKSLSNFILKNLKIDKVKSQIIPKTSILSYQLNENLINLVEFIKIVSFISSRRGNKKKTRESINSTNSILQATTKLVTDLKSLDLVQQQVKLINDELERASGFDLNDELGMGLDTQVLKNTVTEIKESITASTKSILNNI